MAASFKCVKCGQLTLNFKDDTVPSCRKCGSKTKRLAAAVGHEVRETKDNGWMPDRVDQLQNQEQLFNERIDKEKK
jgi:DNA-directed RNA polymerase subunit RPC12/RpoP